jgi:hypothetical protein
LQAAIQEVSDDLEILKLKGVEADECPFHGAPIIENMVKLDLVCVATEKQWQHIGKKLDRWLLVPTVAVAMAIFGYFAAQNVNILSRLTDMMVKVTYIETKVDEHIEYTGRDGFSRGAYREETPWTEE